MAQDPDPEAADTENKEEPVDGRRVALIIGNGDYGGGMGWTNLPNAGNDAQHIADILSNEDRAEARFEVELVTNGTREEIIERLAAFAARAATADVAMVYFSGHGFEFNLDNYIVPVDAPAVVSQTNIDAHFINMSEIVAAAETDGFSIFFLDACSMQQRWATRPMTRHQSTRLSARLQPPWRPASACLGSTYPMYSRAFAIR
jgi:hypothetical protein